MSNNRRPLLQVHAAVLLFGFAGLFGKLLDLSPLFIVFGRTAFAALALIVAARLLGVPVILRSAGDGLLLMLLGVILSLHWITFFHAIQLSTVAIGILSFSSFPLFVTVLEPLFFRERLRSIDLLTSAGLTAGLMLLVPSLDITAAETRGVFWGGVSGGLFALLQLCNRKYLARHSALKIGLYQNLFAAAVLFPVVLTGVWSVTLRDGLVLAVLGIGCTGIAHVLFIQSLTKIKAHLASVIAGGLEPVYGTLFAFLLLGEQPALRTLIGGAIILVAVVTGTLVRR